MTMRDCADGAMRDLLPLYVRGKLSTPDQGRVESHVGSCADCAAEVDLLRAVSRAYPAPAVDVASIAARMPSRRTVRAAIPFHRQPLWRAAASLTLFIAGTATVLLVRGREPAVPQVGLMQPTAHQGSSAAETTLAMAAVTGNASPRSGALLSLGTELSDLTESQLESLLGSLDGLDLRPQADPMTIATPIIQDRTQAPDRNNQ